VIISAVPTETEAAELRLRVAHLEAQLRRERSRRKGVERGLDALSQRLAELQRENADLRRAQRAQLART
jgi:septal ring factor EnvC (AmiA/AmiB activator)